MNFTHEKRWLYPGITFIGTMILTLCIVYLSYQSQYKYNQAIFNNLADRQVDTLKAFIDNDLDHIGAGANFFHATQRSEWDHFPIFAEKVVNSSESLITLQWMEKVEESQIPQFVAHARLTYPNYQIYTIPKGGTVTPGYVMPAHQPIYAARDIYPVNQNNEKVLGFYSSRQRFQHVLEHIQAQRNVSVSDKVRLIQDGVESTIQRDGILVYHPVFDMDANQPLIGVVIGIIRTSHYFDSLMVRTAAEQDLEVRVIDLGFDAADEPVLLESDNWFNTRGFEVHKTLTLPNRQWDISFRLDETITTNDRLITLGIFAGGFVIACLLSYIVLLQTRAKSRLESLLEKRTRELQFLVDHDSLTGLYSRRAFNQMFTGAITEDRHFTLISFDIDTFKRVNDSYGHAGGDKMLVHVARTVEQCLEPGDVLIRLGGDEFCIISNVLDRSTLQDYLNVICQTMADREILINDQAVSCSLSIGAAIRYNELADELIHLADVQLYKSKLAGRNMVSIAE